MPLAMTIFVKALGDLPLDGLGRKMRRVLLDKAASLSLMNEEIPAHPPLPYTFSPPMPVAGAPDGKPRGPGRTAAARALKTGERFRIRMTWLQDAQVTDLQD